jgi:cellulose synthase/poly-beta-1,6-N-acetylglucosamine synthase-like glycosyltransferase
MEQPTIIEQISHFFESGIFIYGTTLLISYSILAGLSLSAILRFQKEDRYIDYQLLVKSKIPVGISVIAPAFNEGLTIISNVRSLMNLNYPRYEVIIVNDGSTDDTLQKMIGEFDLVRVDFAYNARLKSFPVRNIFRSTNPAYGKLTVVDKVNGKGKADAINAGINISSFNYFLCTDVDCILNKDTLLRLIKPIIDEPSKRVIATGATLRMANSCEIEEGSITRVRVPKQIIPRFQEVEYIRAFVLGKMGWSAINCVPNVSGGLGLFDKEIAIKAGGYDPQSFGEDMELLVRMCSFCCSQQINYAVRYIPVTLCWTEGPPNVKILRRQRIRWSRGLIQLMSQHRKVLFNPAYGRLGLIVMPYNFFFELIAPLIETIGIIYYIIMIVTGNINAPYAILLLIFVYIYSVMITTLAILWDQLTYKTYKTWKEIFSLCLMPFFEMILYHPMIVLFSLRGYFNFLARRKHSWGNMQRQGFVNPSKR